MSVADTVFGSPGTQNYIRTGGTKDPGYDFAKQFFNFLPQLMQQAYPTYQGSLDPGLSPTMQDAIRRAQGYAQSGPAQILQGVQGTLGNFMSPSFLNPFNALMGGNPNYGGANPFQTMYGGRQAGSYGGFAGGSPGMGMPAGQGWPGNQALGSPGPAGGAPPGGPPMPTADVMPPPQQAPGAMSQDGFQSALNMNFNDAQGALARGFQGNAQGLGGALAQQYGMDASSGHQNDGRGQFMHSTDHLSALQRILGREPTFDEVQQSLRSGAGNIEKARTLFLQDDNSRRNWSPAQADYAKLVDQYGLAKGGQMFTQQYGNGPLTPNSRPLGSAAPGGIPPLGGGGAAPPSGPIMAPPSQGGPQVGNVDMSRPGAPAPTPAPGGLPPLGSAGNGSAGMMGTQGPQFMTDFGPRPTVLPTNGGGGGMMGVMPQPGGGIKPPPVGPGAGQPFGGQVPPLGSAPNSMPSTPATTQSISPVAGQTYGGYTADQLNADPSLKDKLGNAARRRLGMPLVSGPSYSGDGITRPINRPRPLLDTPTSWYADPLPPNSTARPDQNPDPNVRAIASSPETGTYGGKPAGGRRGGRRGGRTTGPR